MTLEFNTISFPEAIKTLFELNNYSVQGPIQKHGAEIDLVAQHKSDPFASPIYIEATIEYVDNDKYGRDLTKLALIREKEPEARRLIVSQRGFSLPVQERARESRVQVLTYDQLFAQFEKFDTYVTSCSVATQIGLELAKLNEIYEEPHFEDEQGKDLASEFLTHWRSLDDPAKRWLIVVGEYGTGKTALTRVLQYRWLSEYKQNPSLPIPFRIELRDFTRQFDARGLLHHFLDNNSLGHIPIDFVTSLLKSGRIVLLLDGYDEMAQYLHARERRTCLSALAELSAGGAKGILTSRPNYFTEAEELQVFEILYLSLDQKKYFLTKKDKELFNQESQVDQLLKSFLDRYERRLKDLTPEQTESLVSRALSSDPDGKSVVLGILNRVFRSVEKGETLSLSGKPVIISYLLDVVEGLKDSVSGISSERAGKLSEWDIYKLIVDQLMLRDLHRSPELDPEDRRQFLAKLSIKLSQKHNAVMLEDEFKDMVAREFHQELRRHSPDQRPQLIERYFADLRGSATLTTSLDRDRPGWRFSHNSLREYLVAEHLLNGLITGQLVTDQVPISDAMRLFVASREPETKKFLLNKLIEVWRRRAEHQGVGQLLCLLWDGLLQLYCNEKDPVRACLSDICRGSIDVSGAELSRISFSSKVCQTDLQNALFHNCNLTAVDLTGVDLSGVDFSRSLLDGIVFSDAILDNADFSGSFLTDVDLAGASMLEANFANISADDISILVEDTETSALRSRLEKFEALGFINFHGGRTEIIPSYYIWKHHPHFPIVKKIIEKLKEDSVRQRRGLEQRGAARRDVGFSRDFVSYLENEKLINAAKNRKDLVEVTEQGRAVFGAFVENRDVPIEILRYLQDH